MYKMCGVIENRNENQIGLNSDAEYGARWIRSCLLENSADAAWCSMPRQEKAQ